MGSNVGVLQFFPCEHRFLFSVLIDMRCLHEHHKQQKDETTTKSDSRVDESLLWFLFVFLLVEEKQ